MKKIGIVLLTSVVFAVARHGVDYIIGVKILGNAFAIIADGVFTLLGGAIMYIIFSKLQKKKEDDEE